MKINFEDFWFFLFSNQIKILNLKMQLPLNMNLFVLPNNHKQTFRREALLSMVN